LKAQYKIKVSVVSSGGYTISSSSFRLSSTLGQTFIGQTTNNSYQVQTGFWKLEQTLTPVEKDTKNSIPKTYKLEQNYPNPFNLSTIIRYDIPAESYVTLKVYDILGKEVKTLINEIKPTGSYKISFNAANLTSGIYFYRINAQNKVLNKSFVKTGKMILLK